jgi:hypothetical protein
MEIGTGLSDGGGAALAGARFSIHDLTFDDINAQTYNGSGTLMQVSNAWTVNVLNSVSVNHITAFPDPTAHMLSIGNATTNPQMWGFNFVNSIVMVPKYPVWNKFQKTSCAVSNVPVTILSTCFKGYSFNHNALIAPSSYYPASSWPTGNYFPGNSGSVQFMNFSNGNGGDYRLQSSSPYKNAASDGKDLGADINMIQSAISGVY